MAENALTATPSNMQLGLALVNPRYAYRQAIAQQQQQLAQQLMTQGSEPTDYAKLANPGGFVVPVSPLAEAAKAVKSGLGGYLSGKALGSQLAAYSEFGGAKGGAGGVDSNAPNGGVTGNPFNTADIAAGLVNPEGYKASLALQNAGPMKAAETANTPYITPQGTYSLGGGVSSPTNIPVNASSMPPAPIVENGQPQAPANMNDLLNQQTQSENASQPVELKNDAGAAPDAAAQTSLASDGKPFLSNLSNIPAPDPTGTPKFNTVNTKTGVEQTIQDQKDAAEGNKAFAATAQSLSQENSRLDNLIDVYKQVQSGTLTAQNADLINKLVGLGIIKDPAEISDLSGVQNATQNHILQVIQQIKDTNANAGGGAPTRTFGSEITKLLENGESAKAQPEALWNVIGQAKGLVEHHLDMANGWVKSGGLGNRMAGGYTMRPDDYAQRFTLDHNISDYRDAVQKRMGPFKGMPGNTAATPVAADTKTIGGVTYHKINGVWHQ